MVDDLVTRGVTEPYRMFTSRAEFRLRLRADNADRRLTPVGEAIGCIGNLRYTSFNKKLSALKEGKARLQGFSLTPNEAAQYRIDLNADGRRRSALELLAHPAVDPAVLARVWPEIADIPESVLAELAVDARYEPYVARQSEDIEGLRRNEQIRIPPDFMYQSLPGLSVELQQKLDRNRPVNLAQAARIDGMTPAALLLLLAHIKKAADRRSA